VYVNARSERSRLIKPDGEMRNAEGVNKRNVVRSVILTIKITSVNPFTDGPQTVFLRLLIL
jgi:hypothetical protein